jgi:hypothetical protein
VRNDEPGAGKGALPKLTLSQRILAALPNLQRAPGPAPRKPDAPDGGGRRASTPSVRTDEAIEPDEVIESNGAGGPRTVGQRFRDSVTKPAPTSTTARANPYADRSREELEHSMKYLDDQERFFALLVGPLVAVLDIILTVIALHSHQPHFIHGHVNKLWVNPTTTVSLGIGSAVVACLVVVCALLRRRSLTIFALLFSGYGGGLLTMLPSWAMAGWLFVHFSRMQKALRQMGGGRPRAGGSNRPRQAARAGAASARDRSAARTTRGRKQPIPAGPPGSKRYTPPKPTRPRPPPAPS